MLQLLRDNCDSSSFRRFLQVYNGVTIYYVPLLLKIYIWMDFGGQLKNYVYALSIPENYMGYNIAHLEMLNVVVAFKLWGHHWANKCVKLFCDNQAVVDVLSSGTACDQILATSARNVWLLTATYNIALVVSHIQGAHNNVADLLSRWKNTEEN